MRKSILKNKYVVGSFILLITLSLIFTANKSTYETEIEFNDIFFNTITTFVFIFLIYVIRAIFINSKVYELIILGMILQYSSALADLLDEFYNTIGLVELTENLGLPLGISIVTLGLFIHYRLNKKELDIVTKEKNVHFYKSITDNATGLYNKRYLYDYFETYFKNEASSYTLIIMDIDDFKIINDNYGHIMGDQVIKIFSKAIHNSIRQSVDYAFRYGGDEFLLFVHNPEENILEIIVKKIEENIASISKTLPFQLGVTLGIASQIKDDSIDELIIRADKDLYKSKQEKKGFQ